MIEPVLLQAVESDNNTPPIPIPSNASALSEDSMHFNMNKIILND